MRVACLFLSILSLMGCRDTATLADGLPAKDRVVVLVPETLKGGMDPRLNTRAWPAKIIHLVFEGVVSVHNADLAPRPALAERIDRPTPEIYDIVLRADARFHDGQPVTAEDVRATYASVVNPALRSPFRSIYARIKTMEVLGPRRLRITLKGPHAPFMSDLSLGILPARIIGQDGHLTGPALGAGPYSLSARAGQREVVLRRFDDYWRGRPRTKWLVFRTVRDQNTRLLALLGGAADLVQNAVSPRMAAAMKGRAGLTVESGPGVGYTYLAFNLRDEALGQVRVRQALAHAINRAQLIEHKFRGVARPARGMLPAGHWAYAEDAHDYAYDPARARALLDAAGWPDPPGAAPRFKMSIKVSTDKFRRNLARLIARDLRAVGVEVKVQAFELGTLLADVKSGNFQSYILQWGDPSEPHLYNWIFHSDRIPTATEPNRGGNRGGYINPTVDALIERGRTATTADARAEIYRELQRILARDLPYLSLWHEDVVVIRRSALEGYTPLPNASLFNLWRAGWKR